jgi:hypothetical protein
MTYPIQCSVRKNTPPVGGTYPLPEGKRFFENPDAGLSGRSLVLIPFISSRGAVREYYLYSLTAKSVKHAKLLAYERLTRHAPYDPATQQAAKIALRFCEVWQIAGYHTLDLCFQRATMLSHNTIKPLLPRKTHKKTISQKHPLT